MGGDLGTKGRKRDKDKRRSSKYFFLRGGDAPGRGIGKSRSAATPYNLKREIRDIGEFTHVRICSIKLKEEQRDVEKSGNGRVGGWAPFAGVRLGGILN